MSHIQQLFDIAAVEVARIRTGVVRLNGIPSGIGLERLVPSGIPRGKITAVYSSEGNFKTTLVTQLAIAAATAGFRVLNLTLEDSAELVVHRYLARLTGVPFGVIHGGALTDEQRALVVAAEFGDVARRIFVVDDLDPYWARAEAAVNALRMPNGKPGIDMVILDYVQMFGRDPKTLDDVVFGAQRFAKANNVAIVFVSQQVKPDTHDDNPRPKTENMFGSSALRMGCKLAIGLFRPWVLCKAPSSPKGPYGPYCKWLSSDPANVDIYPELLEVHVTKNFAGPPGAYTVRVNPGTGIIEPYHLDFG